MDYQLVFSPDLGLEPETFVEAWNTDAGCRAVAHGRLEDAPPQGFDLGLTGAVLIGVATGLAANALYDLIGGKVEERVHKRTEIVAIEQADGTRLLVVKVEEG